MAEYIEREALMDRLTKKKAEPGTIRYTEGFNDALMRFRSMLHSAPAADVVEVRHGKWVRKYGTYGEVICSACKTEAELICVNHETDEWEWLKSNYCPHCGAKMDLE